jgi:hypothetical protein
MELGLARGLIGTFQGAKDLIELHTVGFQAYLEGVGISVNSQW